MPIAAAASCRRRVFISIVGSIPSQPENSSPLPCSCARLLAWTCGVMLREPGWPSSNLRTGCATGPDNGRPGYTGAGNTGASSAGASAAGVVTLGYDTILTPRQPGSTMKPLLYALALERGWTAATLIDDSELSEAIGDGQHTF